ncbi:MAG TPA: glycosyltransferase [Bryobacteraceae bacterium]|nr:glycosyltransferase [Bryobacteraceae bacterium]
MRICLSRDQVYPARTGGIASSRVQDNLAKGLADLGHEVHYYLPDGLEAPLPSGIRLADRLIPDADVWHVQDFENQQSLKHSDKPWVRTYHSPFTLASRGPEWQQPDNWIFVSRAHAAANGCRRFVHNGVDPEEYVYSLSKDDYFLFTVHDMGRAAGKGFGIALHLKELCGFRLIVAGGGHPDHQEYFRRLCVDSGATFVGWVQGTQKAELFAGAKALLFPTQVAEPFGVVVAEALMSGTPVVASEYGACPELVTDDVGFVCRGERDYLYAIENIGRISPVDCRNRALTRFHYQVMASGYIQQYRQEISNF